MPPSARLTAPQRRESIIQTAIDLFSERGFRGTTTRELAAACGVSEPMLYQHFPSKSDLYAAMIDSVASSDFAVRKYVEMLQPFADARDDMGYFKRLTHIVIDFYRDHKKFIRLLEFSSLEGHELAPMFHDRLGVHFLANISGYIQLRIDEGAFRPGNPELIAGFLLGAADHFATCTIIYNYPSKTGTNTEEWVEQLVQTFLQGVQVR